MDYIKFKCYDLAVQDTELYNEYSKIQMLYEELVDVINLLDPQIKNYENLQHQLMVAQNATADISAQILTMHNALDKIIDIYYAAENKVKQSVEELPVESMKATRASGNTSTERIRTSTINRGDLVLEDWLAELLYKYDRDENKAQ